MFPLRVFVGTNYWSLSGVNVFCENLTRGLRERGFDARLLLTEQYTSRVARPQPMMELPSGVPIAYLPAPYDATWATRWGRLIRFLESEAPCVVIPNSDYRNSCVMPYLSKRAGVVGVVHSDDPLHYDHVARLGETWSRIVAVSETIRANLVRAHPRLASRFSAIPIGVAVPPVVANRNSLELRAIYHGVLAVRQKRIFDLIRVLELTASGNIPFHLVVAGTGPDEAAFRDALAPHVEMGRASFVGLQTREQIAALLDRSDVFLMTSEFEGMPHALLEAMAHGCVPIVTTFASGGSEVIRDGENGLRAAIGDAEGIAAHLARLHEDRQLFHRLSAAARNAVAGSCYTATAMLDRWESLLDGVDHELQRGVSTRSRGTIVLPPAEIDGVSVFPIHREVIPGVGEFPFSEYDEFRLEARTGLYGAALRAWRRGKDVLRRSIRVPRSLPWWRVRHAGVRLRIFALGYVPRPLKRAGRAVLTRVMRALATRRSVSAEDAARR